MVEARSVNVKNTTTTTTCFTADDARVVSQLPEQLGKIMGAIVVVCAAFCLASPYWNPRLRLSFLFLFASQLRPIDVPQRARSYQ